MEAGVEQPPEWFRNLVWGSLIAGCCPPLPLPFVDDWARNYLRRRLARRIVADQGKQLTDRQIKTLAGENPSSCLWEIVSFPFRWFSLLRMVLWVASINRYVRTISAVFLEAYLMNTVVRKPELNSTTDLKTLARLRSAIENTRKKTPINPFEPFIRKGLGRSATAVRQFSRAIAKRIWNLWKTRRNPNSVEEEAGPLPPAEMPWAEELIRTLWDQRTDFTPLEQALERELTGIISV